MSAGDPLIPMSDRPRWETDPAPAELVEVVGAAIDADVDAYAAFTGNQCNCQLPPEVANAVLDSLAAPENRSALVGWLIAEGIAVPTGEHPTGAAHPTHLPLFLLDGAP